jgi:RNA polymerase sigma-70 factor (ECF subfamily)
MVPRKGEHAPTFEDVYVPLFPVIYRVAYRIVGDAEHAEDICHEAFIRYMQRLRPLPDVLQARYWLLRVVRNLSLNHEKRRSREARAFERVRGVSALYAGSAEDGALREEMRSEVQRALNGLPHGLRTVLVLKEYGGLSYREIGTIMGISEGNVKVRVYRARERLAHELDPEAGSGEAAPGSSTGAGGPAADRGGPNVP